MKNTAYLREKSVEFVADRLEKDNVSKLKLCIQRYVYNKLLFVSVTQAMKCCILRWVFTIFGTIMNVKRGNRLERMQISVQYFYKPSYSETPI